MKNNANVLSIDWDFFFDGAGDIAGSCVPCSWLDVYCDGGNLFRDHPRPLISRVTAPSRMLHQLDAGEYLQGSTSSPVDFLRELQIKKGAPVSVAECHADIWPVLSRNCHVLNIDAHEDREAHWLDSPFEPKLIDGKVNPWHFLHCGCWCSFAEEHKEISMRWVGQWSSLKQDDLARVYDQVFICQSLPYTPAGYDRRFYKFLVKMHARCGGKIEFLGPHYRRLRHGYERASLRAAA